jgi:hypothetical protein
MSDKKLSTIDVESEGGIAEAFELAAKQGVAEISLRIPVPHGIMETHGDAIDRLRARGTPIELISSYILAEKWEDAQAAFRCSVLELIYERLIENFEADVQFLPSTNLHRQVENDTLCMIIDKEPDQKLLILGLDGAHDNIHSEPDTPRASLPLASINATPVKVDISDDINASIVGMVDRIATDICNVCLRSIKPATEIGGIEGKTHLYIIPDLSRVDLVANKAEATIAICGFRG